MQSRELIRLLKSHGCTFVRRGKGDHQVWYSPSTGLKFTVPHPKKNLPIGTLKAILRAAGIDVNPH